MTQINSLLENVNISSDGYCFFKAIPGQEIILFWNILGPVTGSSPTLRFSLQELDPSDNLTNNGKYLISDYISSISANKLIFSQVNSVSVKISWILGGSAPSFSNVSLTVISKTIGNSVGIADSVKVNKYDIQDSVIYIGIAPQGALTSNNVWLIKKVILDINGNPTSTLWSSNIAIWDNRSSETYT